MLSREGGLLCYCDTRKLEWYLGKGLAVQVGGGRGGGGLTLNQSRGGGVGARGGGKLFMEGGYLPEPKGIDPNR